MAAGDDDVCDDDDVCGDDDVCDDDDVCGDDDVCDDDDVCGDDDVCDDDAGGLPVPGAAVHVLQLDTHVERQH